MKKSIAGRRLVERRKGRKADEGDTSNALNPVRARRGRDGGDEAFEDESEEFRKRAEWWRLYHGDRSGVVSGELRLQAIALADQHAVDGIDNGDPGGARPRSGFELVQSRDETM